MAMIDSCSESSYLPDQVLADLTPCLGDWMVNVDGDSYSENSYLPDQVLADLPPLKWQFHRSLI